MTYIINYADGSSIVPQSIHVSIDEIAYHLASSKVISRKRIIEHAYLFPRLYTVAEGKNHTLLTVEAIESLLRSIATDVEAKDRAEFEKTAKPITAICEGLQDYKRMTCAGIIGVISSSKI